ncbi:uncharacterized protein B0P05DRAFT_533227, partial [Gilbertella persicaria]|uniref:uncharacterized protein n=1 Tax=Gilbertella persicaria TaxID=101096 RepID=UPI00221FD33C
MNRPQPPSLPLGWIALWDEASQRYYYVEQATGTTQWEIPTSESKATPDYHNGFPQQMPTGENSTYHGATNPVATTYPTQPSSQEGVDGERGLGKVFHGFSGGAIAGSLFGFAAGKFLGNHNHHGGVSWSELDLILCKTN